MIIFPTVFFKSFCRLIFQPRISYIDSEDLKYFVKFLRKPFFFVKKFIAV